MIVRYNQSGIWVDGYDPYAGSGLVLHGSASGDGEATHGRRIGFRLDREPPVEADDPDAWYAAEVERMRERAPA